MIEFTAILKRFDSQGEKTGWTYIDVPEELALQLKLNNRQAFRVQGRIDNYDFKAASLVPMGGGNFILAVNATMRKGIAKGKGAMVNVQMMVDEDPIILSSEMLECLADEPMALRYFNSLPGSHQKYFSRWIESAKTVATKAKRIAQIVTACTQSLSYGEMIRAQKNKLE